MSEHSTRSRRFRAFVLGRWRIPGWLSFLLGLASYPPDWKARWDFWVEQWSAHSAAIKMIAPVLTSPFLGISLIGGGLVWLWFFRGVVHVHHLPVLAETKPTPLASVQVAYAPPDWPIRDLFLYLQPDLPSRSTDEWDAIGAEIQDKLSTGELRGWGRKILRGGTTDFLPLAPIDKEYWQRAEFTYVFLLDGHTRDKHVSHYGNSTRSDYGDLQVNRAQATAIWPLLPLREAAQIVYDETRHSLLSGMARALNNNGDDVIRSSAQSIISQASKIFGSVFQSTVLDLLSKEERTNLVVFDDCASIGYAGTKRAKYFNIQVPRSELSNVVEYIKRVSNAHL